MVQYIVFLLDDTSASFCHYANPNTVRRLMPLEILRQGVLYSMKENLNIQFVYPDYQLPKEHLDVIESIDHVDIKPASKADEAGIVVLDGINSDYDYKREVTYVVRTDKKSLFNNVETISSCIRKVSRLIIFITDIESFNNEDFDNYKNTLSKLSETVERLYVEGSSPQFNLLTDRILLDKMNNCGAGETSITLAPDGCFYVCPAFYLVGDNDDFGLGKAKYSIGNIHDGLSIKNPQLYKLDHAPLCSHCDAFQCRRCIWLNRKMTYEVNVPGHEQCVVAHIERNASKRLLEAIRKHGEFLPGHEIKSIDYLDPFEEREKYE